MNVCGPKGEIATYTLFDNGSTITLVDKKLTREADVEGKNTELTITGISENERECKRSKKVMNIIETLKI